MGFALDAFKKYQDTAMRNDVVSNGNAIKDAELGLSKTGGQDQATVKTDNRLSLALAGDGFKKQALDVELDSMEAAKKRNLDGFEAFA